MKKKQFDVGELARYLSQKSVFDFVNAAPNAQEKQRRIEDAKKQFFASQSNFTAPPVNFSTSGYCEDFGNPEMTDFSIYDDCRTFAEFSAKAKQETAIQKVKSLVLNHDVAASVRAYSLQRNSVVAANRAKKAEREKQKKDKFVSHPSW